jgi:acyl-CoA thioesterase
VLAPPIDERWTFSGRVFGGYSAAVLVRAAAARSPLPELLSVDVTFLRALLAEGYEVEVEEVRSGRTSYISRATVIQNGRAALIGDVWMGESGTLPPVDAALEPEGGEIDMGFFVETYPFMGVFEEIGVSYMAGLAEDVPDPPASIDVWMRSRDPLELDTPLERQLFGLMAIDGHIIDAAVRPGGMQGLLGLSHNLTVHWTGMPTSAGWFRLRADAQVSALYAATRASLSGAGGRDCAWALQHGRVVPDQPVA